MSDAILMWRHTKMVVLVALTAALYAALLVPFKPIPIIPGFTELRPANVVPVVCSLLFGPAAAWGSAIGNLVGDFFGTLGPGSFFGFIGNFLLGYLPYRIFRLLAPPPHFALSRLSLAALFDVCFISAAVCALVIAWGVDLLGFVPFKVLATVITVNNFIASFALGVVLLPLLYPRAVRWRLVYWDIMPQEELEDGPFAWPALVLIVVFALAGTSWAAMLWFGGESLTRLAETISVRQGATILALGLMVLAGLLSRRVGKRHTVSSLEVAPATSTAERGVLAIEVSSLTFSYKNASRPALSDVSFSQRSGEFRCVMGHTGAGKTTLTLALSAVVPWLEPGHFSGSVRVFGSPISNMAPRQLAGRVGLVQQDFETQLLGSRVESVVAFPLENLGIEQSLMRSRVEEALQTLDIAHLRGRDPNFLSGGEKQRVVLASVLALRPDVVILDEPTTDLDPAGRRCVAEAWNRLREAGYTLLVTDHDPAVAASADVLTVLRDGKIVFDGPPGELLSHPDKCIQLGVLPTEAAEIAAALNLPPTFETSELLEHLRAACLKLRHSVALGGRIGPWPQPQDTLVFVDDLRAGYGNHEVLHGLDLEVRKGELVALLGPNGSGKTTLAKCIDGLLAPTGGRVQLAGRDPFQMKRPDVACVAGMVFQNPDHQLIATSVLEELHLGPRLAGLSRTAASDGVEWAIEVTGLKDVVNEDPFALPKGIRQKVALASVLAFRPPVIIFDEPTTGLDGPEQLQMMELLTRLAREGHAVLVITHAVWVAARYASRVVVLSRGRVLLDGTPRAVFAQADVLAQAGIEPPPSVQVSQQVLGQTLLAPAEFAEHVELRHTNGWSANP